MQNVQVSQWPKNANWGNNKRPAFINQISKKTPQQPSKQKSQPLSGFLFGGCVQWMNAWKGSYIVEGKYVRANL